jgi:hypothetical protein
VKSASREARILSRLLPAFAAAGENMAAPARDGNAGSGAQAARQSPAGSEGRIKAEG